MAPKKRDRKKRRATAGSFKPIGEVGEDPRRHAFSRQEAWLGYAICYIKHPHLRPWLKRKVYLYRLRKEQDRGPQEE